MIRIKCFGVSKEIVNSETIELDANNLTVRNLKELLLKKYPDFKTIQGFMIAINQAYAEDNDGVNSEDEVAIIPPVSGG